MVLLRAGIVLSSDGRMTMQTLLDGPATPTMRSRTLLGTAIALVAAIAVAVGTAGPAAAATGAVTGEWDVIAASTAQSPRLQSYDHDGGTWGTVTAPNAWFAVGAGKVINGDDADEGTPAETPVAGGGIRFENTTATARTATITMRIPAGTGLRITSEERSYTPVDVVASSSARTVTFSLPSVAAGAEYHEHFTWTFATSASAVNLSVGVSVPGTGGLTATSTYRFTF